jgi:hypothetical protein
MMLRDHSEKGEDPSSGSVLEIATDGVIQLRPGVKVWMYVSTLPVCEHFAFFSRFAPYGVMLDNAMEAL